MEDIKAGQRNTRQRQEVYETVMAHHDHPTADEIYLDIRSRDDKISRGTVYRNLNLLSETEELNHIRVPGVDRFDSRLDHHYHMICSVCGKVVDVPLDYQEAFDKEIEAQTGFTVKRHRMVFEGICPDCRKKED